MIPLLRQRGYEFAVVTSHGDRELPDVDRYQGVPIYRFHFWQALATREIELLSRTKRKVSELKRAFKPDLIHVNLSDPSVFFHLHSIHACRAPMLVSIRVALPKDVSSSDSLLKRTLSSAAWVTANSNAVLTEVRRLVPEITDTSSLIYNGLDLPDIPVQPLPFDSPRLICLGRLVRDKGFDVALEALPLLVKRFPSVRMIIVGDGPARAELQRQAIALGVGNTVEFIGWVEPERVPTVINSATVLVMPSRWEEAFGLVALEAAMMARPVVATSVGGLPEVVTDQHTGLLVPKDNSAALADAIAFLLSHPYKAEEMGRAGRLQAQQLFSLDRYVESYDALYQKLVS